MAVAIPFRPVRESSLAPDPLSDPLEFIRYDHFRQLTLCSMLICVAENPQRSGSVRDARWMLDYLRHDMPLHVAAECEALLPLLRRRCLPADRLDALWQQLCRQRKAVEALQQAVVGWLEALVAGRLLQEPRRFVGAARNFADAHAHHLARENMILLPLARRRLTAADRVDLGRAMAAHHGMGHAA